MLGSRIREEHSLVYETGQEQAGCCVSLATLIRRMTDAGAPPEAIALAVEEIEALQACLDARRTADRDRKRAQREREKTADVTGQSEDCPETVTDKVFLDKEKSPRPPKEINPFPCVRTRARVKHPLPANWQPAPLKGDGQAGMIAACKPAGWLERQLSKFKDHALQNNRLCSDWDAAWRNWIKQADEMENERISRSAAHTGGKSAAAFARFEFGPGDTF